VIPSIEQHDPDIRLMLRAKEGDSAAFEALFQKYHDKLVRYLFHRVLDHAVAEDLAQDTFLRVYCARERYEATAKFTSWLYQIAVRVAINWMRDEQSGCRVIAIDAPPPERNSHRAALREFVDPAPLCDEMLDRKVRAKIVRRALSKLPDRQRTVVVMHKYLEMPYLEIAARFRCSIPCVKSLLFRAYIGLEEELLYSDATSKRLACHSRRRLSLIESREAPSLRTKHDV
jgi:RNA polymerase sigma-70 factor (ECF subfamily)